MGKLDTIMVNGPEDDVLDWDAVDWRRAEDDVRRPRQRIFTASKAGDLKKVRNLQNDIRRADAVRHMSVDAGTRTADRADSHGHRPQNRLTCQNT